MKETCKNLFNKGKIGYTVFAVFIVLLSFIIIISEILLKISSVLIILTALAFVLVDVFSVFACIIYKKSAYYIEIKDNKALFYTEKACLEKQITDCQKVISTGFEFFLFFNDEKIRLCRFHKCKEINDCISEHIIPNIK